MRVVLDWAFLSMDILGGVFSLLALGRSIFSRWVARQSQTDRSVAAQGTFDVLGGIMYILV